MAAKPMPPMRAGYAPKGGEVVHAIAPITKNISWCGCEVAPCSDDAMFDPGDPYSCRRCIHYLAMAADAAAKAGGTP